LEHGQAELDRFPFVPETLRAVIIGKAPRFESVDQSRKPVRGRRVHVADQDAETVAMQMSRLELVAVPAHAEQADSLPVQLGQALVADIRHRDHLPRYGMSVLHPSGADLALRNPEPPGHLSDEELGSHVAL